MKNYFLTGISVFIFMFLFIGQASAASINLAPSTATFNSGDSFTVNVSISPESSKIYTAKLNLKFPADMLVVESWSFSNSWSPLSQSGYDLVDNSGGTLIKTAGYPGGLSSNAQLGSIRFRALKQGTANISVTASSALYDANSENALSGKGSASYTINTPKAPEPVIERILAKPETKKEVSKEEATTTATTTVATTSPRENTQTIIVQVDDNRDSTAYLLVVSIFLAFIAGFVCGKAYQRVIHHKKHLKKS